MPKHAEEAEILLRPVKSPHWHPWPPVAQSATGAADLAPSTRWFCRTALLPVTFPWAKEIWVPNSPENALRGRPKFKNVQSLFHHHRCFCIFLSVRTVMTYCTVLYSFGGHASLEISNITLEPHATPVREWVVKRQRKKSLNSMMLMDSGHNSK
ncbi:hypothetical protein BS47DRAFT_763997 [Hydnum rufescens UP504]|uniref:Uncharacterized protein n=1 Tax=Hydnum rufescens UP504 TaxID=1448309 RepID=A0A9P6B9U4_9AGAM|nr:hypothetical protein BS47DRAFT_763997 [Hydnum rufescens UP504]